MLNIAVASAFVIFGVIALVPGNFVETMLAAKYGADAAIAEMLAAMEVGVLTGVIGSVFFHRIVISALAIVRSVGEGDPFRQANARRVLAIAWGMLGLQILDLCLGAVLFWIRSAGAETMTWSPAIGGWIAVLLLFVLARVFQVGADMRDDLEGTV
ncbi:DUF2975 domain-containing protein [Stakelama marina]|uniref:DUF2975 domain-containing protein n=1 Tax=Stakelama marina TaxID=2826939 RepID=A0A8T4I8V5_9SPHN|nr:DUF2975 domain-containing protein [Stakelama marina]MBR0551087.1 DUF2975 domain-containing protein [Stakelama marina]